MESCVDCIAGIAWEGRIEWLAELVGWFMLFVIHTYSIVMHMYLFVSLQAHRLENTFWIGKCKNKIEFDLRSQRERSFVRRRRCAWLFACLLAETAGGDLPFRVFGCKKRKKNPKGEIFAVFTNLSNSLTNSNLLWFYLFLRLRRRQGRFLVPSRDATARCKIKKSMWSSSRIIAKASPAAK